MKTRGAMRLRGLVCASLFAACAPNRPTAFVSAFAAGDRAHHAGRSRDAAIEYLDAARATGRPVDRDEAIYRAAMSFAEAGDREEALTRLDWLAIHSDPEIRGDRGAFDAARLRMEWGDAVRAVRDFETLAVRSPDSGLSRRAVELAAMQLDRDDPSGTRANEWLASIEPRVRARDLEVTLRWMQAHRADIADRSDEAIRAYERLLEIPYPRNTHWDDGGFAYAQRLVAVHRAEDALHVIDRILAVRETAVLRPGSDERPHYQDLGLLRARILRDEVRDPARAAEAFHRFYVEFPDSRFRDDALWSELQLRDANTQHDRACDLAVTLAREFACTRHGRNGAEFARTCGRNVAAPDESRCHPHRGTARSLP